MFANILSQPVVYLFIFFMASFEVQKFLMLMRSRLSDFSFMDCAFGVVTKKSLLNFIISLTFFSFTYRRKLFFCKFISYSSHLLPHIKNSKNYALDSPFSKSLVEFLVIFEPYT